MINNKLLELTSLSDLKEETIKKLANYATFTRGLVYFNEGRIVNPIVADQTIQAEIIGSGLANYVVSVEVKDNKMHTVCNCPSEEYLCKHTIALLYAWIKTPENFKQMAKIQSSLEKMRKEELIDLLLKLIKKDPAIFSTLNLNISKNGYEKRRYGEQAILPLAFKIEDYQQLTHLLTKLKEFKKTSQIYLEKHDFQNGLKILQSIIQQSITNYKKRQDVDGLWAEFIEECLADYSKISSQFPISQKEVFFNDFVKLYLRDNTGFASSLTELILTQCHHQEDYNQLERILLRELPNLKDNQEKEKSIELLLEIYDKKGDHNRYLEVCRNNLNNWRNCIHLAEKLQQLGREDEAIQWYQKTMGEVSEEYPKLILKKKLATLYEKTNKKNEALNLHFEIFKEQGNLTSYKRMKELFNELTKWEKVKNNILLFLGKAKRYPLLIEILLYEKDIDSAIKIALLPHQRLSDIKRVAVESVDKRPTQSIRLFKRLIEYYISLRRKDDYRLAKEYCQELKGLYKKLHQEHFFERYIERIKRLNASKKLLLEELEEL